MLKGVRVERFHFFFLLRQFHQFHQAECKYKSKGDQTDELTIHQQPHHALLLVVHRQIRIQ